MTNFEQLWLIKPLLSALDKKWYKEPSPIQAKSIPHILEGKDIFGCAQTGTGKTAAFALPILQMLEARKHKSPKNDIKALIIAPTRELVSQIGKSFEDYGKDLWFRTLNIFGGVNQFHQVAALKRWIDILVATPGRLLDLINQWYIKLSSVDYFVLDEADRMLDMWFIRDIQKLIPHLPKVRQTMFFSATAAPDIMKLAHTMLRNPVSVEVNPIASTAEKIKQSVYFVPKTNKSSLLKHILKDQKIKHVLVFTRTKHGANKVAKDLNAFWIRTEAIHGNKSQSARERALEWFKNRSVSILVATDIASRGIDVDKLTHVINYDIPEVAENYVHRIGRTGRAWESGEAISLCDTAERSYRKDIQKLIKKDIPVINDHPFLG